MRKFSLLTAVLALLVVPLSATADPPEVQITGHGTIGPISSEEVIRFSVAAAGDETSATGQIEIRTVEPGAFGHWSIHGNVVCINYIEDSWEGHDVWEIRYQMTRSDFPVNPPPGPQDPWALPGAYASFYLVDDPQGDWAGELTGDSNTYLEGRCGFGGAPVFGLLTGDIKVHRP